MKNEPFCYVHVVHVKLRFKRVQTPHKHAYSTVVGAKAQLAYNFIVVAFQ